MNYKKWVNDLMYILGYLLTIFLPVFSIPFSFLMVGLDYKHRKHYMIQNSISLAFFAYCWKPAQGFDLFVWHNISNQLGAFSFNELIKYMSSSGEPINVLLKYIAGALGNTSLLQFIVVLTGFLLLNNIIYHISLKEEHNKPFNFFIVYSFLMSSLLYVHFISGLFYMLALLVLGNGIYYFYENKKLLGTVFLLLSFLIHSSMIFPLIIFAFFYLTKSQLKFKNIIAYVIIALSIGYLIPVLLNYLNHPVFSNIKEMYDGYFLSTTYNAINGGSFFLFNIISLMPILFIIIFSKREFDSMSKFGLAIILISLLVYYKAPIFIRFVYLGNIMLTYTYFDYFSNLTNIKMNKKIFGVLLLFVILVEFSYQIKLLNSIDFISIIINNITRTLFSLFV